MATNLWATVASDRGLVPWSRQSSYSPSRVYQASSLVSTKYQATSQDPLPHRITPDLSVEIQKAKKSLTNVLQTLRDYQGSDYYIKL